MTQTLDPLDVKKDNIWNYEQNKPTLVAKDLELFGVPKKVSYKILLARGVFKWLNVRRELITLKDQWKKQIRDTIDKIRAAKAVGNQKDREYYRGYLRGLEECRKEVRALCHSERYAAPDFDSDAKRFLDELK